MGLDLGSPAIEVAIGLSFVFFLLSIVVSALTEAFAWIFRQRAAMLEKGIHGMLGDEGIASEVLRHPLVQSDITTGPDKKKPSYVSPRNFSLALIDILSKRGKSEDNQSTGPLGEITDGIANVHDQSSKTATQLNALLGSPGISNRAGFRQALEEWFDDGMDRVSGWYRRRAQLVTCIAALIVAVGLKADAVRVTEWLANEETVRAAVVSKAEQVVEGQAGGEEPNVGKGEEGQGQAEGQVGGQGEANGQEDNQGQAGGKAGNQGEATTSDQESIETAGITVADAVANLDELKPPFFWGDDNDDVDWTVVVGLLITAIAISFGAPFWFDALNSLARLRTTGKKPSET